MGFDFDKELSFSEQKKLLDSYTSAKTDAKGLVDMHNSKGESSNSSGTIIDVNNQSEIASTSTQVTSEIATVAEPVPIDSATKHKSEKPRKSKQSAKTEIKSTNIPRKFIKNIPKNVMDAMHSAIPMKLSNTDLISAFVYIHV